MENSPSPQEINTVINLYTEGHYAEAAALAQAMTEQFPLHGFSWTVLGTVLMQMGRSADALAPMQKAAALSPENPDVHNNLGNALHALGRAVEAVSCYRQALQLDPNFVEVHNNLGNVFQELGRLDEAEASYRRAIEISPGFADAHNNLGNTLLDLERLDEAEASYRRAIQIKPDFAAAHSNLGSALMALGKIGEGEISLSRAIELAPGEARTLATALLHIPYRQDDPRFSQLEAVYSRRESLPLKERIKLDFSMGKAMENIGQYDKSFGAYAEGNRLHFQSHPIDETEIERALEKTCSFFSADLFKECAALANTLPPVRDERVPIFIVGMLRSGTTLIEQILASHPAVFGAGELPTLKAVLSLRDATNSANGEEALLAMRKLGQEYLEQVWRLAPNARYITDKLPGNYFHLGLIHLMLPNAKIIHSMRDPVDTCFSCYALRFTHGHEYTYDLGALGRQYMRYRKLMAHWHSVLPPGRILDVRYEDIVADPEHQARRLLDYLGLPWDPSCLKFHEHKRAVHTASVIQVRRPIYTSSVARWKHFEKHLGPLLEIIRPATLPSDD